MVSVRLNHTCHIPAAQGAAGDVVQTDPATAAFIVNHGGGEVIRDVAPAPAAPEAAAPEVETAMKAPTSTAAGRRPRVRKAGASKKGS